MPAYYKYVAPYYAYTAAVYSEYYNYIPAYYNYYTYPSWIDYTYYSYYQRTAEQSEPFGLDFGISQYCGIVKIFGWYEQRQSYYSLVPATYIVAWNPTGSSLNYSYGWVEAYLLANPSQSKAYATTAYHGVAWTRNRYYPEVYQFTQWYFTSDGLNLNRYGIAYAEAKYLRTDRIYQYTAPRYYYDSVIITPAYYAYTPPIYEYTAAIETNPIHYTYSEV